MVRGKVRSTLFRHFVVTNIKGNNTLTAPVNRSKVSENGLTRPARFADAKKEPATNVVASITRRWYLKLDCAKSRPYFVLMSGIFRQG